jgi:hypothetical protein
MPSKPSKPKKPATNSNPKSPLSPSVSRTVLPFAPLALALLVGNAVMPGPKVTPPETTTSSVVAAVCDKGLDFKSCHSEYPTGCSDTGKYEAYLNLLKNQLPEQTTPQGWFDNIGQLQDLERKFPPGLKKTNHLAMKDDLGKLGEGQIFGAVGYLYDVIVEHEESSNCELDDSRTDARSVDFHIYIGFDDGLAERIKNKTTTPSDAQTINRESLIVEMTPHYRDLFKRGWSPDAVKKELGNRVRVVGQLMVDSEHYVKGQDCLISDAGQKCWRGTVWELHPVTDFQVCRSGSCPDQNSVGWVALEKSGVETASNSSGQK